jgi:hypothetical protein
MEGFDDPAFEKQSRSLVSEIVFGPERSSVLHSDVKASGAERLLRDWVASEQEFKAAGQAASEGRAGAALGWGALGLAAAIPYGGQAVRAVTRAAGVVPDAVRVSAKVDNALKPVLPDSTKVFSQPDPDLTINRLGNQLFFDGQKAGVESAIVPRRFEDAVRANGDSLDLYNLDVSPGRFVSGIDESERILDFNLFYELPDSFKAAGAATPYRGAERVFVPSDWYQSYDNLNFHASMLENNALDFAKNVAPYRSSIVESGSYRDLAFGRVFSEADNYLKANYRSMFHDEIGSPFSGFFERAIVNGEPIDFSWLRSVDDVENYLDFLKVRSHADALMYWQWVGNNNIQAVLRNGRVALPEEAASDLVMLLGRNVGVDEAKATELLTRYAREQVDLALPFIDEVIANSNLHPGFYGYRGMNEYVWSEILNLPLNVPADAKKIREFIWQDPKAWIGKTISDDGYWALSLKSGTAEEFSDVSQMIFRVKVPENFPAASVEGNLLGLAGKNFTEAEMLLPRGSSFRIDNISPFKSIEWPQGWAQGDPTVSRLSDLAPYLRENLDTPGLIFDVSIVGA